LDLALSRGAIIISPDYRLIPEVSGVDILQDVRDFYNWLATPRNVDSLLPKDVTVDIDNVLVTGESAGGWLSLQSALLPASRERISAVISHYPMIDMRDPHYTGDYEKHIFTPAAPQLDRSILRSYLENMKKGETITSAVPPDRVTIVISALQQGSFGKMLGDDSALYPLEVLDNTAALPPIWILHGTGDTVIPVEGSYKFEKAVKEKLPETKLHLTYQPGDHGFDNVESIGLETDWVKEGVDFIAKYWPQQQ
jgi:acetyl esterase/lipase